MDVFCHVPRDVASQFSMNVGFNATSHSWRLVDISVLTHVIFLVMVNIFSSENLIINVMSILGITLSDLGNFEKNVLPYGTSKVLAVIVPGRVSCSHFHRFWIMEA